MLWPPSVPPLLLRATPPRRLSDGWGRRRLEALWVRAVRAGGAGGAPVSRARACVLCCVLAARWLLGLPCLGCASRAGCLWSVLLLRAGVRGRVRWASWSCAFLLPFRLAACTALTHTHRLSEGGAALWGRRQSALELRRNRLQASLLARELTPSVGLPGPGGFSSGHTVIQVCAGGDPKSCLSAGSLSPQQPVP